MKSKKKANKQRRKTQRRGGGVKHIRNMCSNNPIVQTYYDNEYTNLKNKPETYNDKKKFRDRFISDYVPRLLEYFKKHKPSSDCGKEYSAYKSVVDIFTSLGLDDFLNLHGRDRNDTDLIAAYNSISDAINNFTDILEYSGYNITETEFTHNNKENTEAIKHGAKVAAENMRRQIEKNKEILAETKKNALDAEKNALDAEKNLGYSNLYDKEIDDELFTYNNDALQNVDIKMKQGSSNPPLISAVLRNDLDAVTSLLVSEANMEVIDKTGKSPLHLAVLRGFIPIIEKLISAGANLDAKDLDGKRPIDYAKSKNLITYLSNLKTNKFVPPDGVNVLDDEIKNLELAAADQKLMREKIEFDRIEKERESFEKAKEKFEKAEKERLEIERIGKDKGQLEEPDLSVWPLSNNNSYRKTQDDLNKNASMNKKLKGMTQKFLGGRKKKNNRVTKKGHQVAKRKRITMKK